MPELLLELFSEEIPARMQDRAAADLADAIKAILSPYQLVEGPIRSFATPRRLTVVAEDVKYQRGSIGITRKGPQVGAPEKAVEGFRNSLSGEKVEITQETHGGKEFYIARITNPPRRVAHILADELPKVLANFSWPKSMRWGSDEARWVRPLHSILCFFGAEVVRFSFAGVESGDVTRGHRFMAPEPIHVRDFGDYREKLGAAKVMLDAEERLRLIVEGAERLAVREGLRVRPDPGLLDELKGLVEWPIPLMGRIDEESMRLPPEVLTTSMRTHQRYLALEDGEGRLAPWFITVANTQTEDGGATVIAGNERVLRARLWDARFFWEQDQKVTLEDCIPRLADMVFHGDVGSMLERVQYLIPTCAYLTHSIVGADADKASRAARLSKSDLVTGMVGEFPELQGLVGCYYALNQNENAEVAQALAKQYSPKGPDDSCPSEPISMALALADKLLTLVVFFGRGIKPTGSKDPFALRRAALGVIRIILENKLRLSLVDQFTNIAYICQQTWNDPPYPPPTRGFRLSSKGLGPVDANRVATDLMAFFMDRLKVHLRGEGVRHDLIAAVFAAADEDDLVRLLARVDALNAFLATDEGRDLLAAYRRASNIVRIEEKKDGRRYEGEPDPTLLREPAEVELHEALVRAQARIGVAVAAEDYRAAMAALAALRAPLDAFFERVMVNADEPQLRVNRLLLLGLIRSALGRVADFGSIEDVGT